MERDLSALSGWAPELAEAFVRLSSDIALVVREDGLIEQVVQSGPNPMSSAAQGWVGRAWVDTVTGDTRSKIEKLLQEVSDTGVGRRREVNHPDAPGTSIPVAYTAIRLGARGPFLAVGRDLRAVAAIQQRFLEVQRETENAYWRSRNDHSRDQLLSQVASDARLLVDGGGLHILAANRAAAELFEQPEPALPGRQATFGFDEHSGSAIQALMLASLENGKPGELRARLAGKLVFTTVSVTPLRVHGALRLVLRVRTQGPETQGRRLEPDEPVVVADCSGRIQAASRGFLRLVRARAEEEVRGRSLQEWTGRAGPLANLVERVRAEGLVVLDDGSLQPGDGGAPVAVGLSAALLTEDDQERIGVTLHPRQALAAPGPTPPAEPLAGWLGTAALPALLRRAAAVAERQLIAAALARSGGDLEATASLLGISREELSSRRREAALLPGRPPVDG
jgi:transcriptional regulator PpsR